jgi:hypothetical protein
MATAAALTQQEGESDNPNQGGIRVLNFRERVFHKLTGCRSHNWSFPHTSKDMKPAYAAHAPYDSHQQCPDCGAMRLFNSQKMEGGPLFQKDVKQNG